MASKRYNVWLYGIYALFLFSIVQAELYTSKMQATVLFHDYYPRCPEVCMYELAQAELQSVDQVGSREFVYRPFSVWNNNSHLRPFLEGNLALEEWIKNAGLDTYEAYFIALAESKQLSDEQKISDRFCQIPPIADLYAQEKAKREELFEQLYWKVGSDNRYPLRRIFEALLYRSGIQLEKKYNYMGTPLEDALLHNDAPLVVQLLKQGVNANGREYDTLHLAKSLDMVHLLRSYGADIKQQQRMHDLVHWAACNEDYDLFAFFFNYTDLNESNQYGEKWFNALYGALKFNRCLYKNVNLIFSKVALLLQHGCRYNADHEARLIQFLDYALSLRFLGPTEKEKRKILAVKQQLKKLFAQDKDRQAALVPIIQSHNNVYKVLQRRARIGSYQRTSYPAH